MARKRTVFTVNHQKASGKWTLTKRTGTSKPRLVSEHRTQIAAVKKGRVAGRSTRRTGTNAQLVVKGRDNRVKFEHTYGADPARTRG